VGFGGDIKKLREGAGISVQKLADKIGVNADRLRKWEEKDLTPRFDDAQTIEAFFGMDLAKISQLKSIKEFIIVPHHGTFIQKRNNLKNNSTKKGIPFYDAPGSTQEPVQLTKF